MKSGGVVIVGGGHAAAELAAHLVQDGYEERVSIISEEDRAPYHRPPLSKGVLDGAQQPEEIALRPERFYEERGIQLLLGRKVVRVDPQAREVLLDDGSSVRFEKLVIATGAAPVVPPIEGADLPGVCTLRSLDDAISLREAFGRSSRVLLVGGGYVGLEVAASARRMGLEVAVLEAGAEVMSRSVSPTIGAFMRRIHEGKGVEVNLRARVEKIEGDSRCRGVTTADGMVHEADLVVLGVGAAPRDELGVECGLACDRGIRVDEFGFTGVPGIHAIGDCSVIHESGRHEGLRLESVSGAVGQARRLAAHLTGRPDPGRDVFNFWTHQYEYKVQVAGLPGGDWATEIAGNMDEGAFAVYHTDEEGCVQVVEAVNQPSAFVRGKAAIRKGAPVPGG